MAGILRIRHRRGAVSGAIGTLLALLGIWGGIIPFIGPYFHYAYTPDTTWTYTTARLWLEILPGVAVLLGGILIIAAASRYLALAGGLLAAAAGAWFALGTVLSPIWNHHVPLGGSPAGHYIVTRIAEQIGFFTGLGVVVVFLAALAIGRILSLPAETAPVAQALPATDPTETMPTQPVG